MKYLKMSFFAFVFAYICLSLQVTLWFYMFSFAPSPQVWVILLVYFAMHLNKKWIFVASAMLSVLLGPYSIFNSSVLFLSCLSYAYIIFYIKNTVSIFSQKMFFVFSLLGFIAIQLFYFIFTTHHFLETLESSFTLYNIYSSLLTALFSILFLYFTKLLKLFFNPGSQNIIKIQSNFLAP